MVKIDKYSGEIKWQKIIFEKDGLSRKLNAYDEQIFINDFCTLYVLSQKNYELIGKWQLDNNLSSDICGMAVDSDTIYCSIRNGKIIILDRQSYLIKEFFFRKQYVEHKNIRPILSLRNSRREIALWNKDTLEKIKIINTPLKLSGCAHIENNFMYISSRNILGIDRIKLND